MNCDPLSTRVILKNHQELQEENFEPSNIDKFREKATLPSAEENSLEERFISDLKSKKKINEELLLIKDAEFVLPKINTATLNDAIDFLLQPRYAILKGNGLHVSYNLFELYCDLKSRKNISYLELVGSKLFDVLKKHYLPELFFALKIDNFELIQLIQNLSPPKDTDIRIHLAVSTTEEELEECMTRVDQFFSEKFSLLTYREGDFFNPSACISKVKDKKMGCYDKRNKEYDENRYATLTVEDLELLLVQELQNKSLFIRDALRLNLEPIVMAILEYGINNISLLKADIDCGKKTISIYPETDYEYLPQVVFDRIIKVIRADKKKYRIESPSSPKTSRSRINEAGLPTAFILQLKGGTVLEEDLMEGLLDIFMERSVRYRGMLEAPSFWLKKSLKNHLEGSSLEAFTLTLYGCYTLKSKEMQLSLWKQMRVLFEKDETPFVKLIDSLVQSQVDFKEIMALIQAKAFLAYFAENKIPNFSVEIPQFREPAILKINLGKDCFFQMALNPMEAFRALQASSHPKLNKLLESFLIPKANLKKTRLVLDEIELLKIADGIKIKSSLLALELKLIALIQSNNEKAFDLLLEDWPVILNNIKLNNAIELLNITKTHHIILEEYFKHSKETFLDPAINFSFALVSSKDDFYTQRGFALFQSQTTNGCVKHSFIKTIAPLRPDLAMDILLGMRYLSKNTQLLSSWTFICKSCQTRSEIFRLTDLPKLLQGIFKIFPEGTKLFKASKEELKLIIWLFNELKEEESLKALEEILIAENFKQEALCDLASFWIDRLNKAMQNSALQEKLPGFYKKLKPLKIFTDSETLASYQEALLNLSLELSDDISLVQDTIGESFEKDLIPKAASKLHKLLEKKCPLIIESKDFEGASALIELFLATQVPLLEESKTLLINLFDLLLDSRGLKFAQEFLFNLKFKSFFRDVEDLLKKRLAFLDLAMQEALLPSGEKETETPLKTSDNFKDTLLKILQRSLDYIETKESPISFIKAFFPLLIKFFKTHDLSKSPYLKKGINASTFKFFQAYASVKPINEIIDLVELMSFQPKVNRLSWLAATLDELLKHAPLCVDPLLFHLGSKVLEKDPTLEEVQSILKLASDRDTLPIDLKTQLIEKMSTFEEPDLNLVAFDHLMALESPKWVGSQESRKKCWLGCLNNAKILDKRIIWFFENASLFNEVFGEFLLESNFKFFKVLLCRINEVLTKEELSSHLETIELFLQPFIEYEEETHKKEIDTLILLGYRILASSPKEDCLEKISNKVISCLDQDYLLDLVEEIICPLVLSILLKFDPFLEKPSKNRTPIRWNNVKEFHIASFARFIEEGSDPKYAHPFTIEGFKNHTTLFNVLLKFVNNKCSHTKVILPLIKLLGSQRHEKLVEKAFPLFERVLKKPIPKNEEQLFVDSCLPFLENVIYHQFRGLFSAKLLPFLNDRKMKPFFSNSNYPQLIYTFIEKTLKLTPPLFYSTLIHELEGILKLIEDNLEGLKCNSFEQKKAIKLAVRIIYKIEISKKNPTPKILEDFFDKIYNYYANHPSFPKMERKIRSQLIPYKQAFYEKLLNHFSKIEKKNEFFTKMMDSWFLKFNNELKNTACINAEKLVALNKKYNKYLKKRGSTKERVSRLGVIVFSTYVAACCGSTILNRTVNPFFMLAKLNNANPICFKVSNLTTLFSILFTEVRTAIPLGGNALIAVFDELCFRVGLQEMLLKRYPKKVLQKYNPKLAPLIDTRIMRLARVFLSAYLFTLSYTLPQNDNFENCTLVYKVGQFALGVFFGLIQEHVPNDILPGLSIAFHVGLA